MSDQTNPSLSYTILIACAAALGGFLFGFDTAVINGAVLALKSTFGAGDWEIGLSVSLALLGAAGGAFFAGQLADRFGRVKCMVVASVLFTVSAIGSGLPFTIFDFIFWRIVGGIGVGAASVIAPAYIAETAPAHLRGRMGSLQQLAIVTGIFAALVSNFVFVSLAGSAESVLWGFKAWQWMFWAEVVPAVAYGLCALFIPESPRYLVARQRFDEASHVLTKLLVEDVPRKIQDIRDTLVDDAPTRLRDLLETTGDKIRRLRPIVFFGMSWGPVVWVMLGEMFNNRIRGSALAVAGLAQWVANFLVSTTFPPLASGLGLGGAYGIYAFFAFLSVVFVVKVVTETKGKELEEM